MANFDELSERSFAGSSQSQERIVEILVYLLGEMHKNMQLADIDLSHLSAKGFTQTEISTAFSWLFDKIAVSGVEPGTKATITLSNTPSTGFRVYHDIERNVLSRGAQGYLLQLRALGLLNEGEMELLIDRILMSGVNHLGTSEVKQLVAGLIFDFDDSSRVGSRMMLNANDTIQ